MGCDGVMQAIMTIYTAVQQRLQDVPAEVVEAVHEGNDVFYFDVEVRSGVREARLRDSLKTLLL